MTPAFSSQSPDRAQWFNTDVLERYVQFKEELVSVLSGILRNTAISSIAQASLKKLYREVFPYEAQPILLIFRYA